MNFSQYLPPENDDTMFLLPVNVDEVLKSIKELKAKKSKDCYGINMWLIKQLAPEISVPLVDLVNASFSNGVFPNMLKIGKVVPVFKNGDRRDIGNYRPVSHIIDYLITATHQQWLLKV